MAHRLVADDDRLNADDIGRHFIFRQHPWARIRHNFVPGFLENVFVLPIKIEKRSRGHQYARSCHANAPPLRSSRVYAIRLSPLATQWDSSILARDATTG